MNLIYMAKPRFGGWVTFTSHLSQKYNYKLYKIHHRTEVKKNGEPILRNFGYGVYYQNISIQDAIKLKNIMITAIDKYYYQYLNYFPNLTKLVIHDPTEVKGKSTQAVIDNLPRFKIITIRKTVKKYLKNKYNIKSTFKLHPFFEYIKSEKNKKKNISISRIDFDKHTEIIIKANDLLQLPGNKKYKSKSIDIYGAKNDLYVYHMLQNKLKLDLDKYYKGTFKKDFKDLDKILSKTKFVFDMSSIKGDGGGSQYTFLEAIYQGCVLVLNKKWVENTNSLFAHNHNCLVVEDEYDILDIIKNNKININKIIKNSKKFLKPHLNVKW